MTILIYFINEKYLLEYLRNYFIKKMQKFSESIFLLKANAPFNNKVIIDGANPIY